MALSLSLSPQGTLSDQQDSLPAVLAGRQLAEIEVCSDSVRVTVQQPRDITDENNDVHNSAYGHCWGHIDTNPPRQFQVNLVHVDPSVVEIEVVIQDSLLEKLPLLHDVVKSTCSVARMAQHGLVEGNREHQVASISLSCSVWGLVSLLLLLEGAVTMKHWFASCCPDSDSGLPAQTLEVCF